jgi:peptidoglycan/LPS O-acetylase OafA/YrhL
LHTKKLISLDVLRGMACFLVWISHIRVATKYFEGPRFDFIQTFTAWGRESVVIFFILSGLVINLTSQNKTNLWEYFKKRFIRIYPIYFAILLICFLSDHFIFGNHLNKGIFIGNVFISGTLPAYLVGAMPLNGPVWSITCEVFFYVIFGLIYKRKRLTGIWVWFGICSLSIIYSLIYSDYHTGLFYHFIFLLNNSFLWILGYLVFEYRDKFISNLPVAICGILMVPQATRLHKLPGYLPELMFFVAGIYLVPLFVYLLRNYHSDKRPQGKFYFQQIYFLPFFLINVWLLWHYSGSLISNKIFYSLAPLLSLVFYSKHANNAVQWFYKNLKSVFKFLARISYPLYLLHMPIMYIIFHFMPNQKFAGMFLATTIILLSSYTFEIFLFEKLSSFIGLYSSNKKPSKASYYVKPPMMKNSSDLL